MRAKITSREGGQMEREERAERTTKRGGLS